MLPKSIHNTEYGIQLIRSAASPGENYIEAIEAFSKKEFIFRLKICKKESKESIYWLRLIQGSNVGLEMQKENELLIVEAQEFIKIFSSSVATSEKNQKIKQ